MKVLSLFDGISSGRLALERAGIPVEEYHAYEIEPSALKISNNNYPDIIQHGDVIDADFTQFKGFDLLFGASPCQSLSICQSKTRQHLKGKSKLFYEFVRALEEVQPKYFLFENVESMNDESKYIISKHLGCEPVLIDAADFSAQRRLRYYWTNIPVSGDYEPSKLVLKDILEDGVNVKYFYTCGYDLISKTKPVIGTLHIKGYERQKRLYSTNYKSATIVCANGGNLQLKILDNGNPRKLTPVECERLQTLPDDYTAGVADVHRYNATGNGWCVNVITHILKGLVEPVSNPINPKKQMKLW